MHLYNLQSHTVLVRRDRRRCKCRRDPIRDGRDYDSFHALRCSWCWSVVLLSVAEPTHVNSPKVAGFLGVIVLVVYLIWFALDPLSKAKKFLKDTAGPAGSYDESEEA